MQVSGSTIEACCGCLHSAVGWAVGAASGPEIRAHRPSQRTSSVIAAGIGGIFWIVHLGALILIWRPEMADGRDISYLLIWRRYFHFTVCSNSLILFQTISHRSVKFLL